MKYSRFLEDYLFYTENNETPEIFHAWVGLANLAGACEKRLWLDRAYFKVYFNLYVVLVSAAGVCAKSTSMDIGQELLNEAGAAVLYGSTSKEKIVLDMVDAMQTHKITESKHFVHCSATYFTDELNVLLSTGSDMVKFLVDIWGKDKSYAYRTKNKGVFEVINPFFNLVGAVVPQWFGQNLANDLSATGFLARCQLIYAREKRKPVADPYISPEQLEARKRCLDTLSRIKNLFGPVSVAPDAKAFYEDWYNKQIIPLGEDYRIAGYLERRNKVHILKVAALLAIGDGRLNVEVKDFENALHLFERTDRDMRLIYLLTGANRLAPHMYRLISILEANGGIMELAMVSRIFTPDLAPYEFNQMVTALVINKEVTSGKDDRGVMVLIRERQEGGK